MISYSFANIGPDSLYEHLYKSIKKDILDGNLTANFKLPSKRSFAKNLGISVITVENAYAQLIAEGYAYSIPKKGFYVADLQPNRLVKNVVQAEPASFFSSGKTSYYADFTSNQTDCDNFPFATWAKLMRELLSENQDDLLANPPCGGVYELRLAIANHLKAFRNMHVAPEQIIIGAGTEYLYGLLIQLLGFDQNYGVENPGYSKIAHIYRSHKVHCDEITMDLDGIRIKELEDKKTDVVHLSPSHHFPTGLITPIGRRYELLGWAAKSDSRYIIEDEYDSEFRFTGQQIPTMQSIDVLEKVIYMNTFSKTLASTVRISYMVLPPHLVQRFYSELSFYSCTVSNFEQYTLARFIEKGYFEKHLNRMRNFYHSKRDEFIDCIKKSPLSRCSTILEADSGLHFLLQIDTELSDETVCENVKKQGIKINSLSQYYTEQNDSSNHIFLINYSSIKKEHMKEAVHKIILALQ